MSKSKLGSPEVAKEIIRIFSPKQIQSWAKVTKGTVSFWKQNGFPLYLEMWFRAKYPGLEVWKQFPEVE